MKNLFIVLSALFLIINSEYSAACTSAIISGKLTPDGRPLLWKHRDTGQDNNRIQYFKGNTYSFIALVNSEDSTGIVWTGTNNAGFSIMNTASYNLKDDDVKEMDMEGDLMFKALSKCKNIREFEIFLKNLPRPMRVEANFGVIDAEGGAAYFEVNNTKYVKVDVNDPKIAPLGFLVYSNYSYTGRFNEGMGYIRYQTAYTFISKKVAFCDITPQWIFDNLSRSYYHSLLEIDLKSQDFSPEKASGWFIDQDFIPRKSSTASVVIQGVKKGEDPEQTIMWSILGYPPAGIAVPLWVKAGENQPSLLLASSTSANAKACDLALYLKAKTFPILRGNGPKYFNFSYIYNKNGTGYMQKLKPIEEKIFTLYSPYINKTREGVFNNEELRTINKEAEKIILGGYSQFYN